MTGTRGFTLIEVIVSLAIVLAMLAAVGALVHTVPLNRQMGSENIALSIADTEIESLRAAGYGALPASGSFSNGLLASLPSGIGALTVTDANAKTKQVVVTVSWKDPAVATSSVSLTTLITQTGGLP